MLKYLNFLLLFLFAFELSQCQKFKYQPGYDFELFKNTPAYYLAKAVEAEDTAAISRFIARDSIPVNYQEAKFGNTLLFLAVINNKNLAARRLLDLGADPNFRSPDNSSPFLAACLNDHELKRPAETLLMLIKYGADVNAVQYDTTYDQFGKRKKFRATALELLCDYGRLESVRVLVENGASLTKYGDNEDAILSTAVLSSNLDIVKYLMIEKKAPIPDYVVTRQPGNTHEKKMTITDLYNTHDHEYKDAPEQQKLKEEILSYLREVGKK